jgi:hypothetical protein
MGRFLGPIVVSVALHAALLSGCVLRLGGDMAAIVCVGKERAGRYPYEAVQNPRTQQRFGDGYDGQFYYAIARNPWRAHHEGIDCPPVRHVRLLYPVVCWLFSGGNRYALFWIMPLVNLLAIGGLTAFGSAMASRHGLSAWWGLLLPLAVNADLVLVRNLTDLLSVLCVCGLLCAWVWEWPGWSLGLWAGAALFSREQNLLVVLWTLSIAVARQRRGAATAMVLALLVWAGWVLTLRQMYGVWPMLPTHGNFAPKVYGIPIPFWGLTYRWSRIAFARDGVTNALASIMLTWEVFLTAWVLLRGRESVLRLAALAGAILAIEGGISIYEDLWSYARVFAWMPLSLWLEAAQSRRRWRMTLLALPVVLLKEGVRTVRLFMGALG